MPLPVNPYRQSDQTLPPRSRSPSPLPPSASPLTPAVRPVLPVASQVIGDSNDKSGPRAQEDTNAIPKLDLIDRPPNKPFSGDDATDAIALRAAISSLQYQRKRAEEDIQTLRKIRDDALARPDDFQQHIIKVAQKQAQPPKSFDFSRSTPDDDDDEANSENTDPAAFPPFPLPQDVVRCPPINWDKYHIVGEPLNRIHEAQTKAGNIARPYDPTTDKLDQRKHTTGGTGAGSKAESRRASASRRQSRT